MTVQGMMEPERARTQPSTMPTSETATAYCHANEYSGACSEPNTAPVSTIPAIMPSERVSNGCRKPRKNSSSKNGARVMAMTPNNESSMGELIRLSTGEGTFGVCTKVAKAETTKASKIPPSATNKRLNLAAHHPSELMTGLR